ncbi:hypothetical protein AB836_00785 [Rickettsiales bacterium (ex Bugula neritina AB1)]|nr:hypothetical protein AB836_00785 [Rickettsiales bacterium (ex Bugula neritina AB1)]
MKRKLIFLNGTSSSYKSTISLYLRNYFHKKFLYNNINDIYTIYDSDYFFFKIMPIKWQFDQDNSGFICKRDIDNKIISVTANNDNIALNSWRNYMQTIFNILVNTMHNIIIVDVICNIDSIINIINIIKDIKLKEIEYEIILIGLKSSIENLNNREKLREDRSIGIAEHQKKFVDDINNKLANFIIDIDHKDSKEIGNFIIQELEKNENFIVMEEFLNKIIKLKDENNSNINIDFGVSDL